MTLPLLVYDDGAPLLPFTHTRPAFDVVCGVTRLWKKPKLNGRFAGVVVPSRWAGVMAERNPGLPVNRPPIAPALFRNGRVLSVDLPMIDGPFVAADDTGIHTVSLDADRIGRFTRAIVNGTSFDDALTGLPRVDAPARWIRQPWDLVVVNGLEIERDSIALLDQATGGSIHPNATLYAPDHVHVCAGASVEAGAVLDARRGPIWIGRNAVVHPLAYVEGPAVIGDDAQVMMGARIREGTTLGPNCRAGGEVEESILFGRSNKYHDGFLGHSVVGEWCNLGALTTTSDLKNTYGTVRVDFGDGPLDSGTIKLGSLIGDHVRTGIGTLLPTGAVVGPASNLFAGGLVPKTVSPFSWIGETVERYDPDRFLATAETAMARRGVVLTPTERDLLRSISLAY